MSTHFEVKQRRAGWQTVWLVSAFLFSYMAVVYLAYSLVQTLSFLADGDRESIASVPLFLITCPINFSLTPNYYSLVMLAAVTALIIAVSYFTTIRKMRKDIPAIVLRLGAERIVQRTSGKFDRQLLNVVEEMAIASGVRVPQVFVLREVKGINSFSLGWRADDAIICVTQGMIDQLSRDELQAVIAHEYSHILSGDTRLSMRLLGLLASSHVLIFLSWGACGTLVGTIMIMMFLIANMRITSEFVWWLMSSSVINTGAANTYPGLVLFCGLASITLWHFVSVVLLKMAVSRRRIYLADAHAVQWTRHPAALISALQKIDQNQFGSVIAISHSSTVSHTTFATIFRDRSLSRLLDTHPAVKTRIRAIESRKEFWPDWPDEKKREPKPELTQDPIERAARDWSGDGQTQDIPIELATISDLLLAVPEPIRQMAADPVAVIPLVFALLLNRDETVRARQFAMIEKLNNAETSAQLREIVEQVDPLAERLRPPLAEITFPTLRELSPEQYQVFRKTVNALVMADGKVDLFEYTFNALLVRDLDLHFRVAKEARVMYHSTQAVLEPFAVVLSAVAYAGNRGDGKLLESYNEGMHIFGHRRPILNSKECTFAALDAALKKLSEASPAVKRRVIRSLTACVMADNVVTMREREILRAIAAMLGIPMPPLA